MTSFNIAELKPGIFFSEDLVLDKTFILLNNMIPLSEPLIQALTDWQFTQVFSNGTVQYEKPAEKEEEEKHEEKIQTAANTTPIPPPVDVTDEINTILNDDTKEAEKTITPISDSEKLEMAEKIYNDYLNYTERMFTRFATHKELDIKIISGRIKALCLFMRDNTRYLLRIMQSSIPQNKNFLVSHAVRSTALAISIGLQLRIPLNKLIELGISCILHELGMLKLPPQLYMTDRLLTISEKKAVLTHPVLGYDILKSYDFPLSICLGVLEHHEKENSSGYPQKLDGSKISMYAKIISVACTFESMTAKRQYKDPQNSNAAIIELLKNTGNQYDENVVKALLFSLSLFPLGTYVYLSDGKIGISTEVNPADPKNPIVELINETDENGRPKTVQPGGRDLSITRALTDNELADLLKSMPQIKAGLR